MYYLNFLVLEVNCLFQDVLHILSVGIKQLYRKVNELLELEPVHILLLEIYKITLHFFFSLLRVLCSCLVPIRSVLLQDSGHIWVWSVFISICEATPTKWRSSHHHYFSAFQQTLQSHHHCIQSLWKHQLFCCHK